MSGVVCIGLILRLNIFGTAHETHCASHQSKQTVSQMGHARVRLITEQGTLPERRQIDQRIAVIKPAVVYHRVSLSSLRTEIYQYSDSKW